jgi:hypothetical protein
VHPVAPLVSCALWLAAPPATSRVGVVWHDQATVAHDARQRLVRALLEDVGLPREAIVPEADLRARVAVAYGFSSDLADRAALLDVALTGAAASYRAGEIEAATTALERIEASLRADPGIAAAAPLMVRAAVLRAQIAWTQGDDEAVEAALGLAVALDPDRHLSTRRVPPPIARVHERLRGDALASSASWEPITVVGAGADVQVDIDGRPSPGAVPPGEHFVVVRRPGFPPVAALVAAGGRVTLPSGERPLIEPGLPRDRAAAEAVCEAADVERILLARQRGFRVAVQAYACGQGFGAARFSDDDEPAAIVATAAGDLGDARLSGRLHLDAPWPAVVRAALEPAGPVSGPDRGPDVVPPKPWFRRVWVWALVGGVVAGAVTTGAVLGTRSPSKTLQVDTDTFTNPPR